MKQRNSLFLLRISLISGSNRFCQSHRAPFAALTLPEKRAKGEASQHILNRTFVSWFQYKRICEGIASAYANIGTILAKKDLLICSSSINFMTGMLRSPFIYMRKRIFTFLPLLLLITSFTVATSRVHNPDAVLGIWISTLGKAHVQITRDTKSGLYFGKIIWLRNPLDANGHAIKDANGNTVMNLTILKNMKWDGTEWDDGTIYDPETTKTYFCSMHLENDTLLDVRGSLDSYGWVGQTEEWVKVRE